jgi:hypothetical protein
MVVSKTLHPYKARGRRLEVHTLAVPSEMHVVKCTCREVESESRE